jgi:hypothetical protein
MFQTDRKKYLVSVRRGFLSKELRYRSSESCYLIEAVGHVGVEGRYESGFILMRLSRTSGGRVRSNAG